MSTVKLYYFTIIIGFFVIVIGNYILGSEKFFPHNIWWQCEKGSEICNKNYGFYADYLFFSMFFLSFLLGFINVIFDKNLKQSLLSAVIGSIVFIGLMEFIIHIFQIPVLFKSFQEGYEHPAYQFLISSYIPFYGLLELLILSEIGIMLCSFIGNLIGYLIKSTLKTIVNKLK